MALVELDDALRAVEHPALVVRTGQLLQELADGPVVELHHAQTAILDGDAALEALGLALDVAHHPQRPRISHHVAHHVQQVRAVVEEALPAAGADLPHLADGPFRHPFPGQGPSRIEAALMGDGQLDAVAAGGDQHVVALAQAGRHGLLAQHGLGLARAGGNRHRRVQLVPGADRDDVEGLVVEHPAEVLVASGDPVPLAELLPRLSATGSARATTSTSSTPSQPRIW